MRVIKNSPSDNEEWKEKREKTLIKELDKIENLAKDSKSHWHKYRNHDYFYDVWSNIHYGYVGLSCGFSEKKLLEGAGWAQKIDNKGSQTGDDPDDVTAIKIGFALFKDYGLYGEGLTALDVLDALEAETFSSSRDTHLCIHPNKAVLENDGTK